MARLKVGDRVVMVSNEEGVPAGTVGTLMKDDGTSQPFCVDFGTGVSDYWTDEKDIALAEKSALELFKANFLEDGTYEGDGGQYDEALEDVAEYVFGMKIVSGFHLVPLTQETT